MPPNMRSILAQVHKKSLSMQSCRNFSSPASKEPKKGSTVGSVVARTLGCATGLFVDYETFTPPGGRGTCHLVQKESGTKFDEIDLSSGEEFTEYNEKGECPVMVSNFRASFSVTK